MGDNAKCNENQKTVQGQRLRTVLQFSRDYGVHPNTVYNWIADGSLPCLKVRGTIRIRPCDDVEFNRRMTLNSGPPVACFEEPIAASLVGSTLGDAKVER